MAVARPYVFEIDFVRNPISESAVWFFVINKFIFRPIFEIKIHVPWHHGGAPKKKFIFEARFSSAYIYLTKVNHTPYCWLDWQSWPQAWELSYLDKYKPRNLNKSAQYGQYGIKNSIGIVISVWYVVCSKLSRDCPILLVCALTKCDDWLRTLRVFKR